MLLKLLTTILIFTGLIKTEMSDHLIKETREKIAQINIAFLKNVCPNKSTINELGKLLKELKEEKTFPKSFSESESAHKKGKRPFESFNVFEKIFMNYPKIDTLKKVFRDVNNQFNSLFGDYFLDDLRKLSKKKIILFSTSMSCECTLEMCYQQESEIQQLLKENPGLSDYAVVDCFMNFDLQAKYEIGFIPTVVILDPKNKELKRFVREENLYSKLSEYLLRQIK